MTIGAATRLEMLRGMCRGMTPKDRDESDCIARCYWSTFILERAFSSTYTSLSSGHHRTPSLPANPCLPSPIYDGVGDPDTCTLDPDCDDLQGVISPSLRGVSIWGDITTYFDAICRGVTEVPWSSDSKYAQIMVQLQQWELDLAPPHRFENILIKQRLPSELHAYREYWSPWCVMQLASHANLAVVNHPFIHLVALRDRTRKVQPKLFLQQIIDQSLFHTGWVIRLLQTFEEKGLEFSDPLMGHQVAATATIPWLFQFAQDQQIAARAREGLALCEKFLERLATRWPHIHYKLGVLRRLTPSDGSCPENRSTVTFDPSSFWDILSSPLSQDGMHCSSMMRPSAQADGAKSTLYVTNKFVQPWPEEQTRLMSQVAPPFFSPPEEASDGQILLDDFLSQVHTYDPWNFPVLGGS